MFTGLIESTGTVRGLAPVDGGQRLTIDTPLGAVLALGDSVATNGVCLTVVARDDGSWSADVSPETLRVTALGRLGAGAPVNLERPLAVGSRLGGHFVQGHVDATGHVLALEPRGQDHVLDVALPPDIERLCIDKGSLCVDGISLTIAELSRERARFWITPHTYAATHLPGVKAGARVNLEADLLAKHVAKLLDGFNAAREA